VTTQKPTDVFCDRVQAALDAIERKTDVWVENSSYESRWDLTAYAEGPTEGTFTVTMPEGMDPADGEVPVIGDARWADGFELDQLLIKKLVVQAIEGMEVTFAYELDVDDDAAINRHLDYCDDAGRNRARWNARLNTQRPM